MEHAATLVAARARERGITIQHETHDNLRISVDPEQMTQALLNVLQNAEEATPIGGIIQVSAAKSQGGVRFTITDSGEGIPASALGKVFNLYFSTKPDGNGLGLPIAQQIVAQHGGTMDIRSAEGMGTTVVIEAPVVDFPR
jgi:signal transduction histidine kinase